MASTRKAQSIANKLKQELALRPGLSSLTIVEGVAADGNPTITIGTLASTGTASAYIKVVPMDWPLAKDILGNAQIPYGPHTVKILKEASPGGTLTAAQIHQITSAAAIMGAELVLYQSSTGGGVLIADIDNSAKLVSTFEPDVWRPFISAQ